MANKLLIVMVNSDPESPAEIASPLSQALAAATMEYDVEVVLSGITGRLALSEVAQALIVDADAGRSAYDLIREAQKAGAVFKVTTTVTDTWGHALIAEVTDAVGGAYLISEAMDDDTVVFTY